ncbi:putative ribonuclease H-like domain-containing protein [Tanacetum coccineum]
MAAHTERIERFENAILKQRDEMNNRMREMFGLLKELTASQTPKKVLIREEARHPITKNVNSISLIRMKEEKNIENNGPIDKGIGEPSKSDEEEPPKEVDMTNEVERKADDEPAKSAKENVTKNEEDEPAGASSSQAVGYYLEHRFNEKLIEVLLENHREVKNINALVDQGSDVNVMPFSIYNKLTDERPAETDIRLSLASHSYIYPLGIAEDVLVDVAGYVYPVDFVILDIREDEKRPFILRTPFLTTTKAVIKYDKRTITLRSGKSKISFHKISEPHFRIEKGIKNDIEPIAPTMTVNRKAHLLEDKQIPIVGVFDEGHPQKEDQGYVDSGCSRHMTGNMSYLLDFKEFDGGYVTFGGGAKGGKITGKGTLKTELFTCLVAKATLDESMLWHRRLGHVNFKTINKLVKENLVRGLPSKHFENDQTCVACLKGKQHKASCKSKIQNSITQPLFMLHMDLFGLTFVSSLMNKKYCLVVTDDYSRFTWVFFLATKDETSGILKSFITEIENLVDKKVKIIRCDNGTEFKNKVMIKAARTMLADFKLPTTFWAEEVNTACYVQNREVDEKSDEGFFVGYSLNIVAGTNSNDYVGTEESIGTSHSSKETGSSQDYILMLIWKEDDECVCKESGIADQEKSKNNSQGVNTAGPSINTEPDMFSLGDNATATHADLFGDETECEHFVLQKWRSNDKDSPNNEHGKAKKVSQALKDPSDRSYAEELLHFKNKKDARGIVIRNKARLVAHGYTQEERIDYDKVFAPVARCWIVLLNKS